MRQIIKGQIPPSLSEYKRTPNATYDGFSAKNDVRDALIQEQKGLCAYCSGRIANIWNADLNDYKTTIEHYKSRTDFPNLQLEYSNMLGVCNGTISGNSKNILHCDKKRGSKILTINPLSKNGELQIKYSLNGIISSENDAIQHDIDVNLNLNVRHLVQNRKMLIDTANQRMKSNYPKKTNEFWTKAEIEKEIRYWNETNQKGNLRPFCQSAIAYLQNKLRRIK